MHRVHKPSEMAMDNPSNDRGVSGNANLVRDPNLSTIFPTLVRTGGGNFTLSNGRGICLNVAVHQESSQEQWCAAEIYFLHRGAQGRFTAFAYAPIPDFTAEGTVEAYNEVVDLWLRGSEVSESTITEVCLQIPHETDEIRITNSGEQTIRDGRP